MKEQVRNVDSERAQLENNAAEDSAQMTRLQASLEEDRFQRRLLHQSVDEKIREVA